MDFFKKDDWQWPVGIFVAYLIFMGGTLAFVFSTFGVNLDLVTDNYYAKTLVYQNQIDSESNAMSLANPLSWEISGDELVIQYPGVLIPAGLHGEVAMYRPSDASLDYSIPIKYTDEGVQRISTSQMRQGAWKMEVSWRSGEKDYYTQSSFYIN